VCVCVCVCVRARARVRAFECLFINAFVFLQIFYIHFFSARRKLLRIKLVHNKKVFYVTVTNKKELLTFVVFIIT
jgi:hypothetical protein